LLKAAIAKGRVARVFAVMALVASAFVASQVASPSEASAWCPGEGIWSNNYYWNGVYRGAEFPWVGSGYSTCDANGWYSHRAYDYNSTDACASVQMRANFTAWTTVTTSCGGYSSWSSEVETSWSGSESYWAVRVCWNGGCTAGYGINTA